MPVVFSHDRLLQTKSILRQNIVVMLFLVLTVAGVFLSDQPFAFFLEELTIRLSRNSFLVLSLIIPILAGVGLNFGIVVGAMCGQAALISITYWGIGGFWGLMFAFLLSTPLAIFLGWLTASLFNRTKGQEMIAGLIVSFFANGIYQFIFLFLVGKVIKVQDTPMLKPDGIGLRNTISMGSRHGEGIKYALDYIFRANLWIVLAAALLFFVLFRIFQIVKKGKKANYFELGLAGASALFCILIPVASNNPMLTNIRIPVVTLLAVAGLCFFNIKINQTKLGQDFRAIGQSQHISSVAGIHLDRTRTIAVIISTLLAGWGQIIFLQNVGTMNTYGSHMQVGMFAIAAILIGGATVTNATIRHAIIGTLLFHSVFIVSPSAGKTLFGDAQIGEFFRAFVVYGVIGVSLALHAWKAAGGKHKKN